MISNLTGLRFFLAIWVVFYHVKEAVTMPIVREVVYAGYLGVDFFFVLSGYILTCVYFDVFFLTAPSGREQINFIKKRFARIYPLHLATLIGAICLTLILNSVSNADIPVYWNHILPQFFLIHAWGMLDSIRWNFPSWSVSAEWFAYIFVFPVVALLFRRYKLLGILSLAIFLLIAWVLITEIYFEADIGLQLQSGIIRIIPEFALGCVAYILAWKMPKMENYFWASVLALLILFLFWRGNAQFAIVLSVPFLLVFLHRGGRLTDTIFGTRVVVYLGEISYSIYMIHFFSRVMNGILSRRIFGDTANVTYFMIYGVLTIIFAIGSYYFIEMPARKWINSWKIKLLQA